VILLDLEPHTSVIYSYLLADCPVFLIVPSPSPLSPFELVSAFYLVHTIQYRMGIGPSRFTLFGESIELESPESSEGVRGLRWGTMAISGRLRHSRRGHTNQKRREVGFARALRHFFACPSIPQSKGFKDIWKHSFSWPRNVKHGVESNATNLAGVKTMDRVVRSKSQK
jgi:hypothetical protein